MRHVEFGARVDPATLAPQPFAIQKMRTGELGAYASSPEMLARRAEPAVGVCAFGEEGPATRLDTKRPVGTCGLCLGGKPVHGIRREIGPSATRRRLDQLAQPPVLRDNLSVAGGGDGGGEGLLMTVCS